MGTPLPLPKEGVEPPKFLAHIYCVQMAARIKMPLGTEVGLSPDDILLDRDPVPFPQNGAEPQSSAHFYCGQTAGCIKMPLDLEVGLTTSAQATLC